MSNHTYSKGDPNPVWGGGGGGGGGGGTSIHMGEHKGFGSGSYNEACINDTRNDLTKNCYPTAMTPDEIERRSAETDMRMRGEVSRLRHRNNALNYKLRDLRAGARVNIVTLGTETPIWAEEKEKELERSLRENFELRADVRTLRRELEMARGRYQNG